MQGHEHNAGPLDDSGQGHRPQRGRNFDINDEGDIFAMQWVAAVTATWGGSWAGTSPQPEGGAVQARSAPNRL